ncbi:MAG: VWA domain-containing protein [Acetobacter sp.]|nr:VWA domain-containing protein [Acetobacter sp.]
MGIKEILQKQDKEAADAVMDTGHYRREAGVRHIKDIVKNPLNRLRIEFSEKFLGAKSKEDISEEYVRDLQNRLEPMFQDSEDKKAVFASHRENFEHFLQTGDLKTPLNLKDEESQFFWGTALALYAVRPEMQEKWDRRNQADRISHSTIWRRIASSSYMQQELQRHAHIVESAVENQDTRLVWSENGYPNISYCFVPEQNLIIDDMLWTLVAGVDAAATAMNHEIAHSKGTQFTNSPRMEEIQKQQETLVKEMEEAAARNDMPAWKASAKKAARLKAEYTYRFYFFDELENMYANRYAVNFGGDFDRAHLNELEADINVGRKYVAPLKMEDAEKEMAASAEKRIAHVKAIARNSFFANNGLIENHKMEDWHSLNLYPELLSGIDTDGRKMGAAECFERIREICDKFETSQPNKGLKILNETIYNKRMTAMSRRRVAMTDEFFDLFVAPHMEDIYKAAEKQLEDQVSRMQNQQQSGQNGSSSQQGEQGDGQGTSNRQQGSAQNQQQENSGQQQNSSSAQPNQSQGGQEQGSPQQSQSGQGQPQQSQSGQGQPQQSQSGQGQSQSGQGAGSGMPGMPPLPTPPMGNQNQQGRGSGNETGQQQSNTGQQQSDNGQSGSPQSSGNSGQSQQHGNSGFPDTGQFRLPNTDIYQPRLSDGQIKELLEKAESIRELKRQAGENGMKANDLPNRGDNADSRGAPQESGALNSQQHGRSENSLEDYLPQNDMPSLISIDDMVKLSEDNMQAARFYREGNWDEYQKYIAQYSNEIAQAKKLIGEIIKQNKFDSVRRGHERTKEKMTQIPVQGGRTIDLQRHVALQQKLRRGDPNIGKKDLERFRTRYKYSEDEKIKEVQLPQSNFGILIDGSGSMTGRPFDNALAISCILYEAARSFKEINVYIYMMGEPYPLTVALPDDKTKEIAKRLESVRRGQGGCNDFLIPAVKEFLKDVSSDMAKHPHVKSGFTHIFSVTDGGNNDYGSTDVNGCLKTMLEKNEQLTFDSFFMDQGESNYTKPLVREMQAKGCDRIDYVDGIVSGDQIPGKIMEMLKKRMKHSQIKEPMTNGVKEKLIIETLKSLKRR